METASNRHSNRQAGRHTYINRARVTDRHKEIRQIGAGGKREIQVTD